MNHVESPATGVPHPLLAGGAWMLLMLLLGAGYLAVQFAYRAWIVGAEDVAFAGRDQIWSLLLLVGGSFLIGATLATVRRMRRAA